MPNTEIQVGSCFKKMEIKMLGRMFIQNPEVSPKQTHTSSFAAAGFLIPRFPGDTQRASTQEVDEVEVA